MTEAFLLVLLLLWLAGVILGYTFGGLVHLLLMVVLVVILVRVLRGRGIF